MHSQGGLTLIIGGPRSGTTWLSKLFDCHPDVLYRHEPDLVWIAEEVPHICPDGCEMPFLAATTEYARRLVDIHTLKTAGSRPVFAKSYESAPLRILRKVSIVGLRALLAVFPASTVNKVSVPEFFDSDRRARLHVVIKSVTSLGRAGLMARAMPTARIILILRNPFGQIASRLRGEAQGNLAPRRRDPALLLTRWAAIFGLTEAKLESCDDVDYLAYEWAILNQKAIDELEGMERVRIVRHGDLVRAPIRGAQDLYEFAGLPWHEATADFIARSVSHQGPERYFDVMRDGDTLLERWREDLTAEQQDAIRRIIGRTPLAARWPELFPVRETAAAA